MQSRIPNSKPLALVIIGLIIGVSLGLGSGYAVFYPEMVNQRNRTIEERITSIENDVSALDQKLEGVNQSITMISESLEGILEFSDVIDQISSRISTLENGEITLNSELNSLEDTMAQLEDDFTGIEASWDEVTQSFSDLETAYNSVSSELEDIQAFVKESDGIRMMTVYIASPPVSFEQRIAVGTYNVLIEEEQDFEDWVSLYGENTAKILLQQEIDAIAGSLVWNPTENSEVGGNIYQIKLETYFTLEFSPAGVTVDNMHLEISATVNIESGVLSTLQVSLVEVV